MSIAGMIQFSLIFLLSLNALIVSTESIWPANSRGFEVDYILSGHHEISSLIGKFKTIVNRFECPKRWKYLGGSCYYLSNISSTSIEANQTCHLLHSNRSNLLQIRNIVQLFYATNILHKNNLSALMVEIDRDLFKDKSIINHSHWQCQIADHYRDQIKYDALKKHLRDELDSIDMRLLKRSKKIGANLIDSDSERMKDIRTACEKIDWKIIDENSTVYMLTTSIESNKTVCLLSDIQSDSPSKHICEYVLDYCFANQRCGKHGYCVNMQSGFACSCAFLYGGHRCDRISKQGRQVIVGFVLILTIYLLSLKSIQWVLIVVPRYIICWFYYGSRKQTRDDNAQYFSREMMPMNRSREYRRASPLSQTGYQYNLIRICWVSGLTVLILILSLSFITIPHLTSSKLNTTNETTQIVVQCHIFLSNRIRYFILPIAPCFIIIILCFTRRERRCRHLCNGRPGLLPPLEPFGINNRFTAAAVFGVTAFDMLQFLDERFSINRLLYHGILIETLRIVGAIVIIGLRYYPVLVSLQLRNPIVRFLVCLYIVGNIVYTIIQEILCAGSPPFPRYYSTWEDVEIRMQLGKWLTVYNFIKHVPYFILFSGICAELCVRLAYDSIYVPMKKKQTLWSTSTVESDESAFAKYYVRKLFRTKTAVNQSRVEKFFHSIYSWNDDFRFTTIALCTYVVAIVFVYYLASTLLFLCLTRPTDHLSWIRYIIETTLNLEFTSTKTTIISSAVIAVLLIVYHLLMAMKNYKRHKLQLFKGIYTDIPLAINFQSDTLASNSIRYCGLLVGHTACSFILYFYLALLILSVIRFVFFSVPAIQSLLSTFIPLIVIYLLIMMFISSNAECLLVRHGDETIHLRSRKFHATYMYFIFFIDCFLGIATCIFRLIKANFFNTIYLARLDFSLHGRSLEALDFGFTAYISYLHMEVAHTNPIMLAFCYAMFDDIVRRRPKYCSDDEIIPGREAQIVENTDEDHSVSPNLSVIATAESDLKSVPAFFTFAHPLSLERAYQSIPPRRQRQARFRWFLAFTMINNYHLCGVRKQTHARLNRLVIARSHFIDEQEDSDDERSPQDLGMRLPMSSDNSTRGSNTPSDSDVFEVSQQSSIQTPLNISSQFTSERSTKLFPE